MAVQVIPNQPFKLIENGETINERNARQMWDRRQFCQLVKTSQTQQFQLRVTEDSGNNVVANGDFTSGMNSWTLNHANIVVPLFLPSTGYAAYWSPAANPGSPGIITQPLVLASRTYKLTFTVIFVHDSPSSVQQIETFITNATQIGGDAPIYSTTQDETVSFTLYFTVDATPNVLNFYFTGNDLDSIQHGLQNVELFELTEPVLSLQDCNGNYIKDVNIVERFEDLVTFTHSWDGLTDGQCYRFCLLGGDDLAANHVEGSFCLTDERGRVLLDEFGNCIQFEIT